MADMPWAPNFVDEDIPIIDKSGKTRHLNDLHKTPPVPLADKTQQVAATTVMPTGVPDKTAPTAPPSAPAIAGEFKPKETAEDLEEIAVVEETVAQKVDLPELKSEDSLMANLVEEVSATVSNVFRNDDAKRRFSAMANLFFRDLRDSMETKAKMTMPFGSGGLGLSDDAADKVMAVIEGRNAALHASLDGRVLEEKQKFVTQQNDLNANRSAIEQAQEQQKLDEMYSRIATKAGVAAKPAATPAPSFLGGTLPAPQAIKPQAEPRIIPVIALGKTGQAPEITPAAESARGSETSGPGVPLSDAIAAVTSVPSHRLVEDAGEPAGAVSVLATGPKAPAPSAAASAETAKPTAPPQSASAASEKPAPQPSSEAPAVSRNVVSDVRFVPKLTGPVEELRSLNLKDFRRLSRDPHEATLKIRDKIDLLEDQSFEAKAAGIKAWQESDINKMYLDLLRKSLEGKPILEIIADHESKGEITLDKAEFDSIMELNRKLRFG